MQEMHNNGLGTLKLVEIEDEVDHHRLYHDPIMNFDLNRGLFSRSVKMFKKLPLQESMMLPKHIFFAERNESVVFGFGVGLATGEYKVIRTLLMHFRENPNPEISRPDLIQAEVYTLGTGKWRQLGQVPYWLDGRQAPLINSPYLDGHVHWIVRDENCPEKICAFNFDNETFKLFPSPPFDAAKEHSINLRSMGVPNGCLSQCDSTYNDVTIWVMNEYGIKNSWHKMANVRQYMCPKLLMFQPINLLHGLKDGGVLMVHYQEKLYAYYPGTNAIEDIRMFNGHFTGVTYRPSFVKLRDFEVESERVRLLKV
nr:F-box associated domain, type 1 [Tanacetum cinerariifolium]